MVVESYALRLGKQHLKQNGYKSLIKIKCQNHQGILLQGLFFTKMSLHVFTIYGTDFFNPTEYQHVSARISGAPWCSWSQWT